MITVTLPDGRRIDVDTDDQATAARVAHTYGQKNPKLKGDRKDSIGGVAGQFLDGILPGTSGFLRGARETVLNAVQAPFSDQVDFKPLDSYNKGKRFQEARNAYAARQNPTASNVAQGTGIAAGFALPASKIAQGATTVQKARAAAKTSGLYGLLSGAMSSDGDTLTDKASDAISTGALSSMVGGAAPVAFRAASVPLTPLRPLAQPAFEMFGKGLQGLGKSLPGNFGRAVANEGRQLTRDPIQARANQALDTDLRGAVNPGTGQDYVPSEVAQEVQRRQSMGVPAAMADVHESARRSFGASARTPGPATAAVRRRIDERQRLSTERMGDHIEGTLGPTTNVDRQAQNLRQTARTNAAPLYDISDNQPIPFVNELQELFQRPSARDAVQVAGRQLRDKGMDITQHGLVEDAQGVFHLAEAPIMPLYDRVKTVLDKTVYDGSKPLASPEVTRASEGAMDIRNRLLQIMDGDGSGPRIPQPGTGVAQRPSQGLAQAIQPQGASAFPQLPQAPPRGSQGLPQDVPLLPTPGPKDPSVGNPFPVPFEAPADPRFGRRLTPEDAPQAPQGPPSDPIPPEGLNPFWKPARDAYGGPIQAKQALELGRDMAGKSGEDISNRLEDLTGAQTDFFGLGHRSELAQKAQELGDWGNVAAAVAGSTKKRSGITAAHGSNRAEQLLDRTNAEHEAHQTWKAVRGNSQTADRAAEMAEQDSRIGESAQGFLQAISGNPGGGAMAALTALAKGDQSGALVKGEIAEKLSSTDMEAILKTIRDIANERARTDIVDQRVSQGVQRTGRFFGNVLGTNMIAPITDNTE